MPLFSDHINNMYYSGTPTYSGSSYSAPYSYTSSVLPLGSSYSASYLNPGGNYSSHSSLASYSRAPLTPRWIPGTSRNYSPILGTISERGTSSPVRVNSPRRIPLSKRSYTPTSYIPRPININTADIDVSRDKYKPKIEDIAPKSKKTPSPEKEDSGPFMPRVDGKPETGIDSSPGKQRSTIKRGRTVVRLHTIKRKERDSPRKSQAELTQECSTVTNEGKLNCDATQEENTELVRWRDKLSEDLTYTDKREKKTLGEKLVEKFLVKNKDDDIDTEKSRDIIDKTNEVQSLSAPTLLRPLSSRSPDRRCSIEMLAEQANLLDTLIRSENLSTATLDLSKLGCEDQNTVELLEPVKRKRSVGRENSLKTTKSDHSLHQTLKSQKDFKDSKHLSKRRSLKKSSSGGSICRLDSITEFSREPMIIIDLPAIEESKLSIKRNSVKTKLKPKYKTKITSSVEVSAPKSPLKFRIENVTVEEKLHTPKKEFTFSAVIDELPTPKELDGQNLNTDGVILRKESKRTKTDYGNERILPSPEPDDGNFWDKIGKRETVYLMKRKQNLEEDKLKNRRALFWFPEDEEAETSVSKAERSDTIYDENNSVKNTDFEYISNENEQCVRSDEFKFDNDAIVIEEFTNNLAKSINTNVQLPQLSKFSDLSQNELTGSTLSSTLVIEMPIKDQSIKLEKHDVIECTEGKAIETEYIENKSEKDQKCQLNNFESTDANTHKVVEILDQDTKLNPIKDQSLKLEKHDVIECTEGKAIETEYIENKSEKDQKCQLNNFESTDANTNKVVEILDQDTKLKITDRGKKSIVKSLNKNKSDQIKTNQKLSRDDLKKNCIKSTSPKKQTPLSTKLKMEKAGSLQKPKISETCPIHGKIDNVTKTITACKVTQEVGESKFNTVSSETSNLTNVSDVTTPVTTPKNSEDTASLKYLVIDKDDLKEANTDIKEPTSSTEKTEPEKILVNILAEKSVISNINEVKIEESLIIVESENIPIKQDDEDKLLEVSGDYNKANVAKQEEKPEEVIKKSSGEVSKLAPSSKRPVKEEPAIRPLIATPRPLQKKVPQIVHSSSSEESSSEDSSENEDANESESSEDSTEFFECENHPDGRTSTGSNDSGFDSSAPASPAGFLHVKKGGESPGPSAVATTDDVILEKELEQSIAYALFRKTGRFTPPARSIPRFRKYNIEDFQFIKVLGKGSFGKVLLAELRDTEYYYAVKCLKKDVVLEDDDVECTLIERKVLALGTNHPYLCHLFATFQTDSHLFFVMEYLNGGDLMFHIQQSGRFPEARSRFYAAEIVSGLKFLHKRGIVYRDLKLDNILLDFEGHVRIADFGMCKLQIYLDKTADTFCGTPDYMAPEIIKGLKYNQTVDWWSFGVLLYEMLIGQSPFSGCDEDELFWSICNEMPSYPRFLSPEALAILTRLLDKDARTRLGGTDCMHGDIREQAFFHPIHWDRLDRRELEAPFKPRVRHPMDTQYFDRAFTGERPRLTAVEPQVLRSMDQEPFRGFSYTNPNATDR